MVLRTDTINVEVMPLPEEGRPADFGNGNVGFWRLQAQLNPRKTTVGQPVTLRIIAQGEGNVRQLLLQKQLEDLEGARVFPATTDESKSLDGGRLHGVKRAEMLIQPLRAGRITIPAFSLPYFDPREGAYREATTRPLTLYVGPAIKENPRAAGGVDRQRLLRGARPVHTRLAPTTSGIARLVAHPFLYGTVLPFGFTALAFAAGLMRRRRQMSEEGRRAMARRRRQQSVARARTEKNLAPVRACLLEVLCAQLGDDLLALPADLLASTLRARNFDEELTAQIQAWLEEVDAARYTPSQGTSRQDLFDEGAALLERVEEAKG